MVVVAIVIAAIAIEHPDTKHIVFWLMLFARSGRGASFGSTLLLALLWKGTMRWGVFAGLISGTVSTIVWKSVKQLDDTLYHLIPALGIALLLVVVVSLMTRPPESGQDELANIVAKY